jgi:hypothetical protein
MIPPIVATELVVAPIKSPRAKVSVPTDTFFAPGKRLITVPATVIAGPFGLSVCDEMTYSTAGAKLALSGPEMGEI